MTKYYVYEAKSGRIVHIHENYDSVSGENVPCGQEELLKLIDSTIPHEDLDIVEANSGNQSAERGLVRVDPRTRQLVIERGTSDAGNYRDSLEA